MTENVTRNSDTPWTLEAVRRLEELWRAGVPPHMAAHALGRLEHEVRAKAVELKLSRTAQTHS
ncbi:MAG: hypothetical protein AB7L65_04600 [Hyphomonadaceae bacterium]